MISEHFKFFYYNQKKVAIFNKLYTNFKSQNSWFILNLQAKYKYQHLGLVMNSFELKNDKFNLKYI